MNLKLPPYLKNKSILFGLGTVVLVIILAIATAGDASLKTTNAPSPSPVTKSGSSFQFTSLNDEKKTQGADYRSQIKDKLPIFVEKFATSQEINTTINIYVNDKDSKEVVRFEIYGLSYQDPNIDGKEAKAYADSFREGAKLLRGIGIDPSRVVLQYGTEPYVVQTIGKWITALKLTP